MNISIRVANIAEIGRELDVTALRLRQAVAQGLSTAILAGREEAARLWSAQYGIPQKQTGAATKTERASAASLAATLTLGDLRIRASKLHPQQTGTGVAYAIPDGPGGVLAHAFIATMRSGHTGVFRRASRPAQRRGPNRSYLPIREQVVRVRARVPDGLLPFLKTRAEDEIASEIGKLAAFSRTRRAA